MRSLHLGAVCVMRPRPGGGRGNAASDGVSGAPGTSASRPRDAETGRSEKGTGVLIAGGGRVLPVDGALFEARWRAGLETAEFEAEVLERAEMPTAAVSPRPPAGRLALAGVHEPA